MAKKSPDSGGFDRRVVLESAQRFVQQNKVSQAIEAYEKLVQHDPSDWNSANTLGDLLVRAQFVEQAIQQYMRIADHQANAGFLARAGAVYKKVLRINPTHAEALRRTAEISTQRFARSDDTAIYTRAMLMADAEPPAMPAASPAPVPEAPSSPIVAVPEPIAAQTHGPERPSPVDEVPTAVAAPTIAPSPVASAPPSPKQFTIEPTSQTDVVRAVTDGDVAGSIDVTPAPEPPPVVATPAVADVEDDVEDGAHGEDEDTHDLTVMLDGEDRAPESAVDGDVLARVRMELRAYLTDTEEAYGPIDDNGIVRAHTGSDTTTWPVDLTPEDAISGADRALSAWRTQWLAAAAAAAESSLERGIQLADKGQWQEAFAFFADAALAPRLRHEAARYIGYACLGSGAAEEAVIWLEWAVQVPAPSAAATRALAYDMAAALEANGQLDYSLAVLRELKADVGTYEDVDARIARLSALAPGAQVG